MASGQGGVRLACTARAAEDMSLRHMRAAGWQGPGRAWLDALEAPVSLAQTAVDTPVCADDTDTCGWVALTVSQGLLAAASEGGGSGHGCKVCGG